MGKEKIVCPACGSPAPPGAVACPNCGEPLEARTEATAPSGELSSPAPVTGPPEVPSAVPAGVPSAVKAKVPAALPVAAAPAKSSRYCPSCGSRIEAHFAFCPECGEPLKTVPGRTPRKQPQTSAQQPKARNDRSRGAKPPARKPAKKGFKAEPWQMVVGLVVVCVAIVALILSGGFGGGKKGREQQQSAAPGINLQAMQDAERYVAAHPEDTEGVLRYANMLYDSQMFEKAVAQYRAYLARNPDNPDAKVDLGVCYYSMKKYDEAIAEMEAAVKAHPEHQLGNFNLGIVNLAAGNKERAKEWFVKTVAINAQNEIGRKAQEMMAQTSGAGGM